MKGDKMENLKAELEYYESCDNDEGRRMARKIRGQIAGLEPKNPIEESTGMQPLYKNTEATLKNESGDRKYYMMIPHIIWHKARTKTDMTVWLAVKMIAGESGYCRLSIRDLSIAAMCGEHALRDSLKYWIKERLLKGQMDVDPASKRQTWLLTIPDVWRCNLEWREQNHGLMGRIKAKAEQTGRENLLEPRLNKKPVQKVWEPDNARNAL